MSQEDVGATSRASIGAAISSDRISFSADFFLDESNFISINPHSPTKEKGINTRVAEVEFLPGNNSSTVMNSRGAMLNADEFFSQGNLIPFSWSLQSSQKLNKIRVLRTKKAIEEEGKVVNKMERRVSLFVDDDPHPTPRLPKCTVLWKGLLRQNKQRTSSSSSRKY